MRKRVLIKAVRRGHLVTLRLCVPELRATLRLSHADYSQLTLLVVAAFAVYIFARICLPVSKLPQPIRLISAWLTKLKFKCLFIIFSMRLSFMQSTHIFSLYNWIYYMKKEVFKVTDPHFKWGFDFSPSRAHYSFRQWRGFAAPLVLSAFYKGISTSYRPLAYHFPLVP